MSHNHGHCTHTDDHDHAHGHGHAAAPDPHSHGAWTRDHLGPWLHRRLTGRSSGDGVSPKRPALAPIEPPSRVG